MAFTFTENRRTNDEIDLTVTCLDADVSGTYTFPAALQFDDVPFVQMEPLGTGFVAGSWRFSALSRTAATITKLAAGGTASGGVRLFIKRGR